jgi:hypothetical protein
MIDLSAKQLRRAAQIKDMIDRLQRGLGRLLGGGVANGRSATKTPRKRRRKMSAAARAKISAAAKARWAKRKAGKK